MRNILIFAIFGAAIFSACQKEKKTENGYRYISHSRNSGEKAKPGQVAMVNIYTYVGDSLMESSKMRTGGEPMPLPVPTAEQIEQFKTRNKGKVPAVFDVFPLMAAGDSVTVFEPLDSSLLKFLPEGLRTAKEIRYEIKMTAIKSEEEIKAEESKLAEEQEAAAKEAQARLPEVESTVKQNLADYKAKKLGSRLNKTESGLEYVLLEAGAPNSLNDGDQVMTHYYGVLKSNGTMFDNSFDRGGPAPFAVGRLVPGFNEGMKLIGRGGKGILFIPYQLAYGESANDRIPAKSDLVFYIEMEK